MAAQQQPPVTWTINVLALETTLPVLLSPTNTVRELKLAVSVA
jgi:hypothetical protein